MRGDRTYMPRRCGAYQMPLLACTPVQRHWCEVHIMIRQLLLAVVSHLADLHDAWGIQAALKKSWEVGILRAELTPPIWARYSDS